jgi:hypothetical protein
VDLALLLARLTLAGLFLFAAVSKLLGGFPKAMMRLALRALMYVSICCSPLPGLAQDRPAFCEPVPDALLGGLQAPYARQVGPNGDVYCEGLLRNPIALPPTSVVSVKQDQAGNSLFAPNSMASLTWCDDSQKPVRLRLRSCKSPMFALDAMHTGKFEWRTDLIARWQPDWRNIAALGIREDTIGGQTYKLVVPLRNGAGYSNSYSFIVRSKTPLHLTAALIEPLQTPSHPEVVNVTFVSGPTKDTWMATIPFERMKNGVYRVTFEEGIEEAGNTTEPIYVLHKVCRGQ